MFLPVVTLKNDLTDTELSSASYVILNDVVKSVCVKAIHGDVINGNIFRVTGHLCGEFTGPRWIPHTKASDAELWCLLWSAPELTVE